MKKSFTLIELIIAIVIIGILAGLGIPRLWVSRDDAAIARIKAEISTIKSAISTKYANNILAGDNSCPVLEKSTDDDTLFEGVLNNPIYKADNVLKWDGNGTDYNVTYGPDGENVVNFKYDDNPDDGCKFYCDSASGEFSCNMFR